MLSDYKKMLVNELQVQEEILRLLEQFFKAAYPHKEEGEHIWRFFKGFYDRYDIEYLIPSKDRFDEEYKRFSDYRLKHGESVLKS